MSHIAERLTISIVESEVLEIQSPSPNAESPIELLIDDSSDSTTYLKSTISSNKKLRSLTAKKKEKREAQRKSGGKLAKKPATKGYKAPSFRRRIRKNSGRFAEEARLQRIVMKTEKESSERMRKINCRLASVTAKVRSERERVHQRVARNTAIRVFTMAPTWNDWHEEQDVYVIFP